MVRFEKFEIWHTPDSGGYLLNMTIVARVTPRTRWRHARTILETDDVMNSWTRLAVPLRDVILFCHVTAYSHDVRLLFSWLPVALNVNILLTEGQEDNNLETNFKVWKGF